MTNMIVHIKTKYPRCNQQHPPIIHPIQLWNAALTLTSTTLTPITIHHDPPIC